MHSWTLAAITGLFRITARPTSHTHEGVGLSTSSFQKTADVEGYISAARQPTISVAALLELARWCQQRRLAQTGEQPCPTPQTAHFPPVDCSDTTDCCPSPTLGSTEPHTTAKPRSTARRTARPT